MSGRHEAGSGRAYGVANARSDAGTHSGMSGRRDAGSGGDVSGVGRDGRPEGGRKTWPTRVGTPGRMPG